MTNSFLWYDGEYMFQTGINMFKQRVKCLNRGWEIAHLKHVLSLCVAAWLAQDVPSTYTSNTYTTLFLDGPSSCRY